MRNTAHIANPSSTPKTGFFATLRAFLHTQGIGASLAVATAAVALLALPASSAFASGDANQPTCPFETEASPGFRSFLPDCRAYELVTPPYEGGQAAFTVGIGGSGAVSPDGEHILGVDFAGFAGTGNEEEHVGEFGAIYEFSRTSSGWSTESLEPPASQYARRNFVAASADLSRSLWKLVVQSKPGEEVGVPGAYSLAVREGVGAQARFVDVGPAEPPGGKHSFEGEHELALRGASRDLTHLVLAEGTYLSERSQLWPGDQTREGDESLYEYLGTDNREPTLVGVSNVGPLQGTTYVNEDAKLISECGTELGAGYPGSKYNAVSADGVVVYFTALACEGKPELNELYARVGGEHAVAISEPALPGGAAGECAGSEPCHGATDKEGVFQGASENGERVFFLSEQPLVSGAPAEGVKLYEERLEGARVAEVTDVSNQGAGGVNPNVLGVARVSEDGSHVYFVAKGALTGKNGEGKEPEAGKNNLYVFERDAQSPGGHTAFIATLSSESEAELTKHEEPCAALSGELKEQCEEPFKTEFNEKNGADAADWSIDDERPVQTTPNGRYLIFTSVAHLTPDDTSTAGQVFEYDAQEEKLVRVSVGQCPAPDLACTPSERFDNDGNTTDSANRASILTPSYARAMLPTQASSELSLSEGGAVVFGSPEALTPLAIAGREHLYGSPPENIYEYREGNVYLISPLDETAPLRNSFTRMLGTDESGDDVFFYTADSLVPQDTDSQASWYDARIGGGFPAPPSLSGCEGDACQGPLSVTPALPSAGGSATQASGENLAAVVPKPAVKPKSKPLTRAQKLAKALKACHKLRSRTSRETCEKKAKSKYGTKVRAEKTDRRGNS